jgi:hypothetical protein
MPEESGGHGTVKYIFIPVQQGKNYLTIFIFPSSLHKQISIYISPFNNTIQWYNKR